MSENTTPTPRPAGRLPPASATPILTAEAEAAKAEREARSAAALRENLRRRKAQARARAAVNGTEAGGG